MNADALRAEIRDCILHVADMTSAHARVFGAAWGWSPAAAVNERLMTVLCAPDEFVVTEAVGVMNAALEVTSSIADDIASHCYPQRPETRADAAADVLMALLYAGYLIRQGVAYDRAAIDECMVAYVDARSRERSLENEVA